MGAEMSGTPESAPLRGQGGAREVLAPKRELNIEITYNASRVSVTISGNLDVVKERVWVESGAAMYDNPAIAVSNSYTMTGESMLIRMLVQKDGKHVAIRIFDDRLLGDDEKLEEEWRTYTIAELIRNELTIMADIDQDLAKHINMIKSMFAIEFEEEVV